MNSIRKRKEKELENLFNYLKEHWNKLEWTASLLGRKQAITVFIKLHKRYIKRAGELWRELGYSDENAPEWLP